MPPTTSQFYGAPSLAAMHDAELERPGVLVGAEEDLLLLGFLSEGKALSSASPDSASSPGNWACPCLGQAGLRHTHVVKAEAEAEGGGAGPSEMELERGVGLTTAKEVPSSKPEGAAQEQGTAPAGVRGVQGASLGPASWKGPCLDLLLQQLEGGAPEGSLVPAITAAAHERCRVCGTPGGNPRDRRGAAVLGPATPFVRPAVAGSGSFWESDGTLAAPWGSRGLLHHAPLEVRGGLTQVLVRSLRNLVPRRTPAPSLPAPPG